MRNVCVALLAINTDRNDAHELRLPMQSERYTLTAQNLNDAQVLLNGSELELDADGDLPSLTGQPTRRHCEFCAGQHHLSCDTQRRQ